MRFVARPWQIPLIEHGLGTPRNGKFAGMGVGKTSAEIAGIDYRLLSGDLTSPTLVIAPLRVATSTWPDEARKWSSFRHVEVQPIIGTRAARAVALRNTNASIFTINYEMLPWLVEYFEFEKKRWPFRNVVADESTRIKSFRTRQGGMRAKALGSVIHKHVDRVTLLSGTPVPNGLKDLWGQLWFLDAGQRLGRSYKAFEERWFGYRRITDALSKKPSIQPIIMPFAQTQIEALIRDICLSLDIRDWIDIADPVFNTIYVDLPPKARRQYDDMERKMFLAINGHTAEAPNSAVKTMKCLQLANGAIYCDPDVEDDENPRSEKWEEVHDVKLQALDSVVEEANGAPVLVAYHFKSDLSRLLAAFPDGRAFDANPQTLRDWNAGAIPVCFIHPASGGHGLNLQDGGNILVFFGHNWNLEEFLQVIERIGPTRQMQAGHDRPVYIHHIVARDTVDEIVMARRESKRAVQDLLIEACKRKGLA